MKSASAALHGLKPLLHDRALALGFADLRVARIADIPDSGKPLRQWLAQGHHGTMGWMAEHLERRGHPARLWPEARSLIAVGLNYGPAYNPLDDLADATRGALSVYARRRDYHEVVKGRLKELAGFLAARTGGDVKVFVDTAPLMERPAAQAAGLGWQGKHTVLISRTSGNWLFLGFILTTADIQPDAPERDHCGNCRRCLAICPTKAFPAPYVLDARRCIAYLTIEHAGPVAPDLRPLMGNRIFGCDDCLAVCPWNKFAQASADAKIAERADLRNRPLAELAQLDDAAFRTLFAGTPVKRTGRNRFVRNVLIAIGNSGDADLAREIEGRLQDAAPLVRGMAVWALHRLAPQRLAAHAALAAQESDSDVQQEWLRAGFAAQAAKRAPSAEK